MAAAVGVDAAVVVAEAEGCGKGIAWAAYVLASAVADAATVALEDEWEAAGLAEAATGPSLKGGEKSVAALSAAAASIAASGCCLGAGCGEGQEVLHPPAGPGEAGGVEAGGAWAAGSEPVTPPVAERVSGGVLQLDYWVGRAAEAERCAKLGNLKKTAVRDCGTERQTKNKWFFRPGCHLWLQAVSE